MTIPTSVPRRFPPGSDWLYLKLYTGMATVDGLVRDFVRPLTESLLQSGVADQWFFIRYADPDWHLRLRVHGSPEKLQRDGMAAVNAMFATLLDDGLVWRAQLDTYEREIERYGGPDGIVLAERLFHADSEAALGIVQLLESSAAAADQRWRLTLVGIDLLLTDFGFDLNGKHTVIERTLAAFAAEFHVDKNMLGQVSGKFRKERHDLEALLAPAHENEHPPASGLAVLRRRSEELAPIIASLRACEEAGRLSISIAELLPSFVHMHANRILRSAANQQELVIYDLLARHYESQLARARSAARS